MVSVACEPSRIHAFNCRLVLHRLKDNADIEIFDPFVREIAVLVRELQCGIVR